MFRILIVCTGNICRSPMAEGILKSLLARQGLGDRVEVRSAGTWASAGAVASDNAVRVAAGHGVRIETHRSAPVTRSLLRDADLILAMEPAHLEGILAQEPEAQGKAYLLTTFADPEEGDPAGIEDPFGSDIGPYEAAWEEIDHLLRVALPRILSRIEAAEKQSAAERGGAPPA